MSNIKIKGKYGHPFGGGRLGYRNPYLGHETVQAIAPVTFYDDFLGQAFDVTHNWTAADTGNATESLVADSPSGYFALALTNTVEIQEASIYPNDFRNWVLNQSPIFEARVRLQTLPTLLSELYFGFGGDYVIGELSAADNGPLEHICFMADGSGVITIHTDDTNTDTNATATGITVLAPEWHVYRIDCSNPADIRFYIDGGAVGTATTHVMSQVVALKMQPVFQAYKSGSAGLGTMWIDYVRIWQNRD